MKDAVFIIAETSPNAYAATTRPVDRGEGGKIGFPGGKVDPNETLIEAAVREACEEGWDVTIEDTAPVFIIERGDYRITWFKGVNPIQRTHYKEKGRIVPVEATFEDLATPEFSNDEALQSYKNQA